MKIKPIQFNHFLAIDTSPLTLLQFQEYIHLKIPRFQLSMVEKDILERHLLDQSSLSPTTRLYWQRLIQTGNKERYDENRDFLPNSE
jgi:hypothetical protein